MKTLLLAILLSLGCAKEVGPQPPIVNRGPYAYQQLSPDLFVIIARNEQALQAALKEIQCGICSIEPNGASFVVRKVQ